MGVHVSPTLNTPSHLSPHHHPSGLSQFTSFECPVSCTELGLVICFTYGKYLFQCYSLKSSHSCLLSQSSKDCFFLCLCLFCCLTYRIIVTIFLNSIYMHQYTVLVSFFLIYFTCIIGSSFIPSLELIQMCFLIAE